jgi:hypothetical protein
MSVNLAQLRRNVDVAQREIDGRRGGVVRRALAQALVDDLRRVVTALERYDQEPDERERHAALVDDWNAVCESLRAFGIDISQPLDGGGRWCWRWGAARGEAATVPQAMAAALRGGGAKPPPPPPLDAQLRAQGAAELPGLDGI